MEILVNSVGDPVLGSGVWWLRASALLATEKGVLRVSEVHSVVGSCKLALSGRASRTCQLESLWQFPVAMCACALAHAHQSESPSIYIYTYIYTYIYIYIAYIYIYIAYINIYIYIYIYATPPPQLSTFFVACQGTRGACSQNSGSCSLFDANPC